jgi:general secretion pathway protein N
VNASDQRQLTPVLMIACVLSAVLLAGVLAGWGRNVWWATSAGADASLPVVQGPRSASPPPLEHFAEIWQRPLFNSDRRPAVAKAAPATDTASLNDFELTGILLTPSLRMALLHDRNNHTWRLREGVALPGGWTLDALEARRAVFKQGGRRAELLLPLTESETPEQSVLQPVAPTPTQSGAGSSKSAQDARIQALKARIEQRRRQQQSSHGVP